MRQFQLISWCQSSQLAACASLLLFGGGKRDSLFRLTAVATTIDTHYFISQPFGGESRIGRVPDKPDSRQTSSNSSAELYVRFHGGRERCGLIRFLCLLFWSGSKTISETVCYCDEGFKEELAKEVLCALLSAVGAYLAICCNISCVHPYEKIR